MNPLPRISTMPSHFTFRVSKYTESSPGDNLAFLTPEESQFVDSLTFKEIRLFLDIGFLGEICQIRRDVWTFVRPKYRIPVPIKLFELISPVHHKKLLELGFMYDQKLPVFAKAAAKMPRDKKFTDFFSFLKCFDQLFAETEVESSPLGLLAAIASPMSPLPSTPSFNVGIVAYAPVSQVMEAPVPASPVPPTHAHVPASPVLPKIGDMVTPSSGGVYKVVDVDTIERLCGGIVGYAPVSQVKEAPVPASPVPPTHAHVPASPVLPVASASLPSHPPTSRFFYSPLCEDDPKFKIGDMVTPSSGGVYKVVDVDTIERVDVERRQSVSAKIIYSYKILEANARVRASMAYSASEDSLSLWREQSLSAPMMRVRGRDVPVAPKRATKRARTSKPKPAQVPVPSYSWDGPDFIEEEECFDDEDDE